MPALKVRIPKEDRAFYEGSALSGAVKAKLVEALEDLGNVPAPQIPPTSIPSESITIWISGDQEKLLDELGTKHGVPGTSQVVTGLLHAWARKTIPPPESPAPPPTSACTTLDEINAALGHGTRIDQAKFFAGLSAEISAPRPPHQVIFAEASTGTGKTRAFLAATLDWCSANPGEHAVISSPSYNVLLQILSQWARIAEVRAVPPWEVLVGQQEFVSQKAMERLLNDSPLVPGADSARGWASKGGKAPADDLLGHPWLIRSLRVATNHEWQHDSEVVLDTDTSEDDAGRIAYNSQFTNAASAQIVFCTHAMLAVEIRRRTSKAAAAFEDRKDQRVGDAAWEAWSKLSEEEKKTSRTWEVRNELLRELVAADAGRLPRIGLLIVDEGHLLEQAFAQVFASGASMARLMRDLRLLHEDIPRSVTSRDLEEMESVWREMKEVGTAVGGERTNTASNASLRESIERIRKLLVDVLARLGKRGAGRPETRHLKSVHLALEVAVRAAGERSGMSTRVSWSPNVQWPSIEVGRYDVSRELDFLWTLGVEDRSVLVSATLYEDVSIEGLQGMRRTLSVRTNLVRALPPVRPVWLYRPVTLHIVGDSVHADGRPRFRRPTHRDRLDSDEFQARAERWRNDVADYLSLAHASAAGGVLVLLTSHLERQEIQSRLDGRISSSCLLSQGEVKSLDALRHAFLERIAQGLRPCLLAVGAAWTGLDLSGDGLAALAGHPVAPEDDNVLTDLVIPTAPIGTNRSLTHEWRRERTGMVAEIGATSLMMRQGIGRLVRNDGIPSNRRLHFLDARIHESQWNSLLQPVVRALSHYTRRQTV